ERSGDAVVPPLPPRAEVAVDETGEPLVDERAEEAEAVPRDVARQDLVDPGTRGVGPDLADRVAMREHLLAAEPADVDAEIDRHGTPPPSRPNTELEST